MIEEPKVRSDALLAAIASAGLPLDASWSQVVTALGLTAETPPTEDEASEGTETENTEGEPPAETTPTEVPEPEEPHTSDIFLDKVKAALHEAIDKVFAQ